MAVNWALGAPGPNTHELFQQGFSLGLQRQRENFLMEQQRAQAERQQRTEKSQARAGERIAAGDLPGARTEAAQSGNLDLVRSINQLTADQRAQATQQAQTLAPVYHQLRQLPYEQRRAELQRIAPALSARGIPADIIGTYDPTDQNLDSDIALGMTLEQQLAQERVNWHSGGAGVLIATDSQGRPVAPGFSPNFSGPTAAPQPAAPVATAPATAQATGYAAGVGNALATGGLPAPVVAGFLGNGHHESGGWNIGQPGDSGTALGAFQWRGERAENFRQVTGADPRTATPEQTAQFVLWELQHPEQAGMTREQAQAILTAPTPEQAALLVSRYYERPNRAQAHDDRRAALASQYAAQLPQQTAMAGPGQPRSIQEQAASGVIQAPPRVPEGMVMNPDGSLAPRPGSQQEFERQNATTDNSRQDRQNVNQIINTYRTDPDVRKWRAARTATTQLQSLGSSGSATDDIAIVYTFMKALDSISAVREGEFDVAQNSAGIRQRGEAYLEQLRRGTRLTPGQRREMVLTAQRMYIDLSRVYNDQAQSYREQAIATGMSPQEAARMFPLARGPQTYDRSRQQRANQGRTPTGVTWRVVH